MQVPLEASALPIAGIDHACSRCTKLRQARPGHRDESLVLQRKTGRTDDLAHSVRILGDPFTMLDRGDDLALAHERRDASARFRAEDRRLTAYGDERPAAGGIGKDQLGIPEEAAQTILQPARVRAGKLEDDARDSRSGPPATNEPEDGAGGEDDQGARLDRPCRPIDQLDRGAPPAGAPQRVDPEGCHGDEARHEHRNERASGGARGPDDPPRPHDEHRDRPCRSDHKRKTEERLPECRCGRHADQVRRTCGASRVGRTQDGRKHTEQPDARRVSGNHHHADGRLVPRGAVGEDRVADDGGGRGRKHQTGREQHGDARARARPAGRKPGERRNRGEPAEWLVGIRRDRKAARCRKRQPGGQPEQDSARVARPERDRRGPRGQPRRSKAHGDQRREQAERDVHALGRAHLAGIVPHGDSDTCVGRQGPASAGRRPVELVQQPGGGMSFSITWSTWTSPSFVWNVVANLIFASRSQAAGP